MQVLTASRRILLRNTKLLPRCRRLMLRLWSSQQHRGRVQTRTLAPARLRRHRQHQRQLARPRKRTTTSKCGSHSRVCPRAYVGAAAAAAPIGELRVPASMADARNVFPRSARMSADLPDSFYNPTAGQLRAAQAGQSSRLKSMGVGTDFSTRKQREDEQREKELARIRRYPKVCDASLPTSALDASTEADRLS